MNQFKDFLPYCSFCLKFEVGSNEKLKRCSSCKSICYCSRLCQQSDYKNHKKLCPFISKRCCYICSTSKNCKLCHICSFFFCTNCFKYHYSLNVFYLNVLYANWGKQDSSGQKVNWKSSQSILNFLRRYIQAYFYRNEKILIDAIDKVKKQTFENYIFYSCSDLSSKFYSLPIFDYVLRESTKLCFKEKKNSKKFFKILETLNNKLEKQIPYIANVITSLGMVNIDINEFYSNLIQSGVKSEKRRVIKQKEDNEKMIVEEKRKLEEVKRREKEKKRKEKERKRKERVKLIEQLKKKEEIIKQKDLLIKKYWDNIKLNENLIRKIEQNCGEKQNVINKQKKELEIVGEKLKVKKKEILKESKIREEILKENQIKDELIVREEYVQKREMLIEIKEKDIYEKESYLNEKKKKSEMEILRKEDEFRQLEIIRHKNELNFQKREKQLEILENKINMKINLIKKREKQINIAENQINMKLELIKRNEQFKKEEEMEIFKQIRIKEENILQKEQQINQKIVQFNQMRIKNEHVINQRIKQNERPIIGKRLMWNAINNITQNNNQNRGLMIKDNEKLIEDYLKNSVVSTDLKYKRKVEEMSKIIEILRNEMQKLQNENIILKEQITPTHSEYGL